MKFTNFIIKKTITQLMKGINKISKSNKNIITENKNLNTLVIHPDIKLRKSNDNRDPQQCLDEAISLTRAISLNVLYSEIITINTPRPGTLMGSGRIADIKTKIHDLDIYKVNLLSNSEHKHRVGLSGYGLSIIDYTKIYSHNELKQVTQELK